MATCRSCNADIEWAEWADSGKAVPLDVCTSANGNLVVIGGKVRHYKPEDAKLARDRRVSHFATCPDSPSWRNR